MDLIRLAFGVGFLIAFIGSLQSPYVDVQATTVFPSIEQIQITPFQEAGKSESDDGSLCKTPQYFELGQRAVFDCSFPQNYFGIFWYNTSELSKSDPIPLIYMKNYTKSGHGYESQEYDINFNGSLIINTVTFEHEENFTALFFASSLDEYSSNNIRVVVTVKPYQLHPIIQGCDIDNRVCFKKMHLPFELTCYVVDARPTVELRWFLKTFHGDIPLHSETNKTERNSLYTTLETVSSIKNSTREFTVYLCKSISTPSLLKNDESMALIQGVVNNFTNATPVFKLVKHFTVLELTCTNQPVLYIVWKREIPNYHLRNVAEVLFTNQTWFQKFYSNRYNLGPYNRSLLINEVGVDDEGIYICTFGNGSSEEVTTFQVKVYIMPDPPYPVIDGCSHHRYCALSVPSNGTVSCSLRGIRPSLKLHWEVVHDSQKSLITFSDHTYTVKERGFAYDVSLTSNFYVDNKAKSKIAVLCKTSIDDNFPSVLSVKIFVVPLNDQTGGEQIKTTFTNQTSHQEDKPHDRKRLKYLSFLCVVLFLSAAVCRCYCARRKKKHQNTTTQTLMYSRNGDEQTDEGTTNVETEQQPLIDKGKMSTFIQDLRMTYQEMFQGLRTLPYGRKYDINTLFVESPIVQLDQNKEVNEMDEEYSGTIGRVSVGQTLESYNNILDKSCNTSTRVILEGDPGYGKSILGLQFAYDWYTKKETSPLKDKKIFILLRMRYLRDVTSLSAAVKRFLLSADSKLTDEDVHELLGNCNSLVIYLDGFNGYSTLQADDQTFIRDILMNKILRNAQVVVTTRPFCLPRRCSKVTTFFKLTGFGEKTWKNYMHKVITGSSAKHTIMKVLEENPLLKDLCQVPLFFVLVTHITTNDAEFFKDSTFGTLTEFFGLIMKFFHEKLGIDQCNNHLRQLGFDGLYLDNGLVWTESELRTKLGGTLYDDFCQIGMLVEDDFHRSPIDVDQCCTSNSKYNTNVRFFHNIFYEWYAAFQLSDEIAESTPSKSEEYLRKINVFDHQYALRFACGMNTIAACKIIDYLLSIKNGKQFAVLCLIEQTSNYDAIDEGVKKLFSSPVTINECDTSFLQSATINLLKNAASKQVQIDDVWLKGLNTSVDLGTKSVKLASGLRFPKLATLNKLSIYEPERDFTGKDVLDFIKYKEVCSTSLRFLTRQMPIVVQKKETNSYQEVVGSNDVVVEWRCSDGGDWYRLNFESGEWVEMKGAEYEEMCEDSQIKQKTQNCETPKPPITSTPKHDSGFDSPGKDANVSAIGSSPS